jgi:hypothetical protein
MFSGDPAYQQFRVNTQKTTSLWTKAFMTDDRTMEVAAIPFFHNSSTSSSMHHRQCRSS